MTGLVGGESLSHGTRIHILLNVSCCSPPTIDIYYYLLTFYLYLILIIRAAAAASEDDDEEEKVLGITFALHCGLLSVVSRVFGEKKKDGENCPSSSSSS